MSGSTGSMSIMQRAVERGASLGLSFEQYLDRLMAIETEYETAQKDRVDERNKTLDELMRLNAIIDALSKRNGKEASHEKVIATTTGQRPDRAESGRFFNRSIEDIDNG